MRKPHRLIVCLDGTWNKRDDTTNVFHHQTLTQEGTCPDGWEQRCYYDEGVGTGVLDRISGGAFGIGLEQNVREACNWLVEHFHDGDEVYVFGFSRGAFTARSLVGFIACCGLLRRGAPLSVTQLWENYCLIGRQREGRRGWLERMAGEQPAARRITELVRDPWSTQEPLPPPTDRSERLLAFWSRRIRIRFLGLYDTVGAIGIDALAIPGLRGRLALHHNLHPTTIIQSCRHALAVDEHRRSFGHNAFLEFRGHDQRSAAYWSKQRAMWQRKIRQRWFTGAHSNIGGGYPDNTLAQLPLRWLLAGAQQSGLCNTIPVGPPPDGAPLAMPKDSYLEFAKPWASEVLRSKRWYREIDPDVQYRGAGPDRGAHSLATIAEEVDSSVLDAMLASQQAQQQASGARRPPVYNPPNVVAYAERRAAQLEQRAGQLDTRSQALAARGTASAQARAARLTAVSTKLVLSVGKLRQIAAAPTPRYEWLSTRMLALATIVLWATFGAIGLHAFADLLQRSYYADFDHLPLYTFSLGALLVLVDWTEGRLGFQCALKPQSARWRACADALYWLRLVGLVLVAGGAVWGLLTLLDNGVRLGLHGLSDPQRTPPDSAGDLYSRYAVPLAGAMVALLLICAAVPALRPRFGNALGGAMLAAVLLLSVVVLATTGGVLLALVFPGWMADAGDAFAELGKHPAETFGARHVGVVLLLLLTLGLFVNSLRWVNNPLTRPRLGWAGMLKLQLLCPTPARVERQFIAWWKRLAAPWDPADNINCYRGPAADAVRLRLRSSLWRDLVGFIPVVALVCFFGLWFAWLLARQADGLFGWRVSDLGQLHSEWTLIATWIAAITLADLVEDISHLHYARRHLAGKRALLAVTLIATLAAWVKTVLVVAALLLTVLAAACGVWRVAQAGSAAGWLGSVVMLVVVLVALRFLVPGLLAFGYRALAKDAD